jgi:hypothetical protein
MTGALPSPGRALLVPLLLALGLAGVLVSPHRPAVSSVRPPLPTPAVLDELIPAAATARVAEPGPTPPSSEGLRSWSTP